MKMIPRIDITTEMRVHAKIESEKRDEFIKHHFEVDHLTPDERDELGFIGEFACCEYLGIDWKQNIRVNYETIDDFDFIIKDKRVDVKTETVPVNYAKRILRKQILDNELYGSRLIHEGQFNLLHKYDLVIFSLFAREHLDYWFPLGYLETRIIINNHPPTVERPDGGRYPFPASPIPTSALKPIRDLL